MAAKKQEELPPEYYKVIKQGSQFCNMVGRVTGQGYLDGYGWYKFLTFPADLTQDPQPTIFGNHEIMLSSVDEYDAQEDGRVKEKQEGEKEGKQEGKGGQGGNTVEPT